MATSEAELREQVFALRGQNPPVSFQKIADQLGISKGVVYRLFHQPAKATAEPGAPVASANGHAAEYRDPVLQAAADRLEAKKLELQEKQLDRQLALLDGKAASGDAGMTMVLLDQMRRMQEDVDRKLALAAPAKPAEDPMTAMVRGMGMLAELQQKAQLLAPAPPTPAAAGSADVEMFVLREKMKIEADAVTRKATSEAERNAFIMGAVKDNLPLILDGLKTFIANQAKKEERPPLQVLEGGQQQIAGPQPGEVPMTCTNCGAKFMARPEPGRLETCSQCGGAVRPDSPEPQPMGWPADAQFT